MRAAIVALFVASLAFGQAPPPIQKPTTPAQIPAFLDATATFIGYVVAQNNGKAQQLAAALAQNAQLRAENSQLTSDKAALQAQVTQLQAQLSSASSIPADWLPHLQSLADAQNNAQIASRDGTGPKYAASTDPNVTNTLYVMTRPNDPAKDIWLLYDQWTVPSQIAPVIAK